MKLLTSDKRQVYAQGDIDGACFLYGIINSFNALTHSQPNFYDICTVVSKLQFASDFLIGNGGTTLNYCKIEDLLYDTIIMSLEGFGMTDFSVSKLNCLNQADIIDAIDEKHVVLVHYKGESAYLKNMDHWVCCVNGSHDDGIVHVACSLILQKIFIHYDNYKEIYHKNVQRWSNDAFTKHTEIVSNEVFRIGIV